jgi:hypothetical protein
MNSASPVPSGLAAKQLPRPREVGPLLNGVGVHLPLPVLTSASVPSVNVTNAVPLWSTAIVMGSAFAGTQSSTPARAKDALGGSKRKSWASALTTKILVGPAPVQ